MQCKWFIGGQGGGVYSKEKGPQHQVLGHPLERQWHFDISPCHGTLKEHVLLKMPSSESTDIRLQWFTVLKVTERSSKIKLRNELKL